MVKYLLSSSLKVLAIQIFFNIRTSSIYLQHLSGINYFPNPQDEFLDINNDIFAIQPFSDQVKLETIQVNNTYSRFVFQNSDFDYGFLSTRYSIKYKNMRKSLLRFDNLVNLSGKNIKKAYLFITGKLRVCNSNFIPREVFVHRIENNYGKIVKLTEICAYNPGPYSSIMVG